MLVVLAMILALAALLLPVFGRVREGARRTSCQSNLKQIGMGIRQYVQDFDEKYARPQVNSTNITATNPYGWADAIQPYVKSTQILQCPSETQGPNPDPTQAGYTDYFYNRELSEDSKLVSSSLTIMNGDGNSGDARINTDGCGNYNDCDNGDPPGLAVLPAARRHGDGANYSFVDGHVKWIKGNSPTQSPDIYNARTPPGSEGSGSSPTFAQ